MQNIINCYKNTDYQGLETILARPEERRVVELWLNTHPLYTARSPLLSDLKGRIAQVLPAPCSPPAVQIEQKILSGRFDELLSDFKAAPQELPKQIDLIKMHLELNTVRLSREWLPLLLDHLSTPDLKEILPYLLPDLSTLSKFQILRLAALTEDIALPPYAERYRQILRGGNIHSIQEIGFSPEETAAAIAHYIERHRMALDDVHMDLLFLAPYLRYVKFKSFPDAALGEKILAKCTQLNTLTFSKETSAIALSLAKITALPYCRYLDCTQCLITALPALPVCKELVCYYCYHLKALPALPLCQKLDTNYCGSLTSLPELPLCKELDCSYNIAIPAIPALPLCEKLDCIRCRQITALPSLPLCQTLDCRQCELLAALPELPFCEALDCSRSTSLRTLPALPRCKRLTCIDVPLRELPELPWDATVITNDENTNTLPLYSLNIEIEKFSTSPVALLLLLGDFLLKGKPFPNIYYFENGERNQAIDHGGVRRDFVTKLCLNLFKELKMEDNFPLARPGDEIPFQTLGALMAHCCQEGSTFKTGPLFDPAVYRFLALPDPGSEAWFLTSYLQLYKAPSLDGEVLTEEDLTQLACLADISDHSRAALRMSITHQAKQDRRLIAIAWMAKELAKRVAIQGNLQNKIEGTLSKEQLKSKLILTDIRIRQYLNHWIDHHELQLEKFVYAVTGNRTLCANQIHIEVYDRDSNFIPVAHTCSFTLELSARYETQEMFDQKIDYFLEHALTGSGFTAI